MKTNQLQKNIPNGWIEDNIGKYGSCIRGVSYSPRDLRDTKDDSSIDLLRSNNIKDDKLNLSDVQIVLKTKVSKDQILKKGDIFICMSNGSKSLVGKNVFMKDDTEYTIGAFCALFHLKSEKVLPTFVKQLFLSDNYLRQIQDSLAGTSINNLKNSHIEDLKFLFPPKPEQEKISEILSKVDEQIEKTEKVIEETEKLKNGLMQELLTKGIGHTKFKKTKIGDMPEGWQIKSLEESSEKLVVGFVGTCDPFYTDIPGIPMLRTGNLKISGLDLNDLKYVTEAFHNKNKKSQLTPGDIVISRHGNNGLACFIPKTLTKANCLNIVIIRANKDILLPLYLYYVINSPLSKKQIDSKTGGSTQKVINTGDIGLVKIGIPPLDEQEKISDILFNVDEKISVNKKLKEKLTKLKKGLMSDLLSGKIRVV